MNFLSEEKEKKFEIFKKEILKHNENLNLLSRTNPEPLFNTLLKRTLEACDVISSYLENKDKVLDVGSGGGFPGLVLSAVFPSTEFVLCDRKRKKVEFLKSTASSMELKNVRAYTGSVEEIEEKFPVIFSQACAKLPEFLKICEKVLEEGALIFLWQSLNWEESFPENTSFTAQVLKNLSDQTCLLKISKK